MIDDGVSVIGPQERAWEHDRVERNVVLRHELVQLHVVRVLPPLSPFRSVTRGDGDVPGRKEDRYRDGVKINGNENARDYLRNFSTYSGTSDKGTLGILYYLRIRDNSE